MDDSGGGAGTGVPAPPVNERTAANTSAARELVMPESTDVGHWLGFDLGGTKMQATLFGPKFQVVAERKKKTRGHEGATAGLDRICGVIDKLLEEAKLAPGQLSGIGVGCPGPLDLDAGIVLEAPNLGWKNVKVKEELEKRYGCPTVVINDVDAGVFGEYKFGAAAGTRSALGVFPGTGIGAGLIYEGKIFRGRKSSCLEIGHFPIIANGNLCGCGRRGCLETVASRLSISAEIAKAAYRGQAPHIMRLAGTDLANLRSGTLAEAIKQGDKTVDTIIRDGARHLGTVIAGTVNTLAPDVIVLGGGLVEALPKLYLEEVNAALERSVMPSYLSTFEVKIAKLGDQAGAMGCAAWARECQAKQ